MKIVHLSCLGYWRWSVWKCWRMLARGWSLLAFSKCDLADSGLRSQVWPCWPRLAFPSVALLTQACVSKCDLAVQACVSKCGLADPGLRLQVWPCRPRLSLPRVTLLTQVCRPESCIWSWIRRKPTKGLCCLRTHMSHRPGLLQSFKLLDSLGKTICLFQGLERLWKMNASAEVFESLWIFLFFLVGPKSRPLPLSLWEKLTSWFPILADRKLQILEITILWHMKPEMNGVSVLEFWKDYFRRHP